MNQDSEGMSELNPPVDGAEIFFLMDDKIVIHHPDTITYSVIATIEPGYERSVRTLLRQAQLGAQTERLMDHYLYDTRMKRKIYCPIWIPPEEEENNNGE